MMSFSEAVKTCLIKKYATISGRATRSEYWWFVLFVVSIISIISIIGVSLDAAGKYDESGVFAVILVVFFFIILIPFFCVNVRRLHDRNYSGWSLLLALIPWIGWAILFFAMCIDSCEG